eukprot:TRINITY_DN4225_c0_g1_i2.p1 TRINITY_DN4225_c0_g1~~TRINITY_DN4225_c0_g1_i2.p1  ORF type:complete len:223 (+),score=16.58 TRINITY_DN4225_c0_g1_i2:42-671(+)
MITPGGIWFAIVCTLFFVLCHSQTSFNLATTSGVNVTLYIGNDKPRINDTIDMFFLITRDKDPNKTVTVNFKLGIPENEKMPNVSCIYRATRYEYDCKIIMSGSTNDATLNATFLVEELPANLTYWVAICTSSCNEKGDKTRQLTFLFNNNNNNQDVVDTDGDIHDSSEIDDNSWRIIVGVVVGVSGVVFVVIVLVLLVLLFIRYKTKI